MSESVSSVKTESETEGSDSTDRPLIPDRWSRAISYRQLIISSCVGIMQLWWHPYIHDSRRLVPFLFLYNTFSVLIGYPMFYLELALGVVTRKGVLRCWDIAPIARGIAITMLLTCIFTALCVSIVGAYLLAFLVHSLHTFLPWLHCAATAAPPCAARHRPLVAGSETPAQSFFHNFVLNLKRDGLEGGLGTIVWELSLYFVIVWLLVYFIAFKRIYSYSKLVLFKDVLTFFTLGCCLLGAVRLEGASLMFKECDWGVLFEGFDIWRESIEYALLEMTASQGSLIMLGSYCPREKHSLGTTAVFAFAVSKCTAMGSAVVLGATHGALKVDYENTTELWGGATAPIILWADFVARVPGSQFWAALVFFTMFVLSLTSVALLIQTIRSTFTGKSIRNLSWAFLILICFLFGLIGVLTLCSQAGVYILNDLMAWPVSRIRVATAALVAMVITYVYSQTTFCEDVYFASGEYPCVFFRLSWAVCPLVLLATFIQGMVVIPSNGAMFGWIIVLLSLLPIAVFGTFYLLFKFRVRNILNEK